MNDPVLVPGQMHIYKIGKLRRFCKHVWWGAVDRFPPCCILRFAVEGAMMDGKTLLVSKGSANVRGTLQTKRGVKFVPCGWFHHSS